MSHILYDYQIFGQRYGGVSRYYYELIQRINCYEDMSVSLFQGFSVNGYPFENYTDELSHWTGRKVSNLPKTGRVRQFINRQWFKSFLNSQNKLYDIYHPTYYNPLGRNHISLHKSKLVVTVYDMIHEIYYARTDPDNTTILRKRALVKEADAILAISQQTKDDLIRLLSLNPDIIFVTPLASSMLVPVSTPTQVAKPFLLYVGARRGYKNFDLLLQAYLRGSSIRKEFDLICFGGGKFNSAERKAIQAQSAAGQVKHKIGNDDVLATLYQTAFALIYPSLYEGFGVPILEAMTLGCPVVTTRCGSIPEVAGDAAFYFDETDIGSLQDSIQKLMTNDVLRSQKIRMGKMQAGKFSWDRTAALTAQVYRKLV